MRRNRAKLSAATAGIVISNMSNNDNLHKGSKSSFDSGVDVGGLIDNSACAKEYFALEECLGENDRKWTKCQVEVKNLKICNDRRKIIVNAEK